jgi:hypothetical protein
VKAAMKKIQVIKTSSEEEKPSDAHSGFKKVFKHQDLEKVFDADKYKKEIEQRCDKLLKDTQKKCSDLEKELQAKYKKDFHSQQVELSSKIEAKMKAFFVSYEKEVMNIVLSVVTKLGIDVSDSTKLFQLIHDKISSAMAERLQMSVSANQKTLVFLRGKIDEAFPEAQNFNYSVKDDLADDECILETDYTYTKVDVSQYFDEFSKIVRSISRAC